jgi:hypothetical protein
MIGNLFEFTFNSGIPLESRATKGYNAASHPFVEERF